MHLLKAASLILLFAAAHAGAQVSVLTQHNDNARTGANTQETTLSPAIVNSSQFGLLFKQPVDDQVYAQPLYVAGVHIGDNDRNVVYVETVNNTIYAFDADDSNAAPYWQVNFGAPPTFNTAGFNCLDMNGDMGIIGTPVIDPDSHTLYVVAKTKEGGGYAQRLHALDLATGGEKFGGPVEISAPGFTPLLENQRPGLLLLSGVVYIAWASHCDDGQYHGFVMGYDAQTLAQTAVFNASPKGQAASIWQSGMGPAADENGNIYVVTGNGSWDGVSNFSESFLKLNAPGLDLADWFTPSDHANMDRTDADLGASGALLIPGTNLVVGGGKTGVLYVLDINNLGQLGDATVLQKFQATSRRIHSIAYWVSAANGPLLYIWGESDQMHVYNFRDGLFQTTPAMTSPMRATGHPGATLSISSNGGSDGVVWASSMASGDAWHATQPGVLRAFDADDVTRELWDSLQNPDRDSCGNYAKFTSPTVANGKVYLASFGTQKTGSGQLCVYGLLSTGPAFSVSAKPAFVAARPGATVALNVSLRSLNGFAGNVQLTVNGLPLGAAAAFSPSAPGVPGASTLTVNMTSGTPLGTYTLTITGTGSNSSFTTQCTLLVSAIAPGGGAVSINFAGNGLAMGPSEIAGVARRAFWNNAFGAGSSIPVALVDETGTSTGAGVTWTSNNAWSLPIPDQPGDFRMMGGYLDTASNTTTMVTVSGLAAKTYDLYVYADGDNGAATRSAKYVFSAPGIDGITVTLVDAPRINFSGTYTEANNSPGNFVRFTFQGTGFTLKAVPGTASDQTQRAPVNGIQIVPR
jgi:hypothetical protein